jgi:hypothetical protein
MGYSMGDKGVTQISFSSGWLRDTAHGRVRAYVSRGDQHGASRYDAEGLSPIERMAPTIPPVGGGGMALIASAAYWARLRVGSTMQSAI